MLANLKVEFCIPIQFILFINNCQVIQIRDHINAKIVLFQICNASLGC